MDHTITQVIWSINGPLKPARPCASSAAWSSSPWTSSHSERWIAALERTGPENVRARLAQTNAGSNAGIAIGTEQTITIGFAQECAGVA